MMNSVLIDLNASKIYFRVGITKLSLTLFIINGKLSVSIFLDSSFNTCIDIAVIALRKIWETKIITFLFQKIPCIICPATRFRSLMQHKNYHFSVFKLRLFDRTLTVMIAILHMNMLKTSIKSTFDHHS